MRSAGRLAVLAVMAWWAYAACGQAVSWPPASGRTPAATAPGASAPTTSAAPGAAFGQPTSGLAVGIELERQRACPGEQVELRGYLWNVGGTSLVVPYRHEPWAPGALHVVTPEASEFVYRPAEERPGGQFVHPGDVQIAHRLPLRLTEAPADWQPVGTAAGGKLSFRGEGTYGFWWEESATTQPGGGAFEWSGMARSGVAALTVAKACTTEPGEDLLKALDLARQPLTGQEVRDRLAKALLEACNEPLAQRVVELLKSSPPGSTQPSSRTAVALSTSWWGELHAMLEARAFSADSPNALAIDGPYARGLVQLSLEQLKFALRLENRKPGLGVEYVPRTEPIAAYLGSHPEDFRFRQAAVAVGRELCRIKVLPPEDVRAPSVARPLGRRVETGWRLLMAIGELKDGMDLSAAAALLGEPADTHRDEVGWYVDTPTHVNPYLSATLKDGKLSGWRIDRR